MTVDRRGRYGQTVTRNGNARREIVNTERNHMSIARPEEWDGTLARRLQVLVIMQWKRRKRGAESAQGMAFALIQKLHAEAERKAKSKGGDGWDVV